LKSTHPIALASGVVPELGPVDTIRAAVAGGWDMVGLWVDPDLWTAETTAEVRSALADVPLGLVDVEVIWIKPGPPDPDHLRILDIGMALGARNALVVSSDPDIAATTAKFAVLCDHAAKSPLRVALEFGLFTNVKTIGMANAILDAIDHPSAALLVDALHLTRSGGTPADVATMPRHRLAYAQICDAPQPGADPSDPQAILDEAVYGRMQAGDGGLDLSGIVAALPPGIPLSVELRSRALYEAFPDAAARSRVTAQATRAFLNQS
jgi:sugar phosphate isomerase/epimerase